MGPEMKIADIIKMIAKQLSGKMDPDIDFLVPEYTIRGSGDLFCYNLTEKMFSKVSRSTLVFAIKENYNDTGKTLIYTYSNELLLIEPEELVYIGYD
tara:strand:- start:218 stop:508 length:291 start_codon:yes stop_codon:yes gene_type:complete